MTTRIGASTTRTRVLESLRYVAIAVLIAIFLLPIVWMIATSFKQPTDILARPPVIFFTPTFENYRFAFGEADFGRFIVNTVVVALGSTTIVVIVGSLAAYSFARFNPGNGNFMFFILTTRMMPAIAVIIPLFVIFRDLGKTSIGDTLLLGLDQPGALIVAHTVFNLPFAIWLMHSFFQDVPRSLEQAALVDGSSRIKAFFRVAIPLASPGIAVTAIFSFFFSWNEFLFANVLTRDAAKTITVAVSGFQTQQGILWGPMAAAATVAVIPTLIFVLVLQRFIVRGLTMGAIK
ncbi:MAG: carbohydrate ABC transporter permease [Acidimicrobiia bacterium]|nr:carbohydrate ABC transporter permease [Acidimicrobiia bacterium]